MIAAEASEPSRRSADNRAEETSATAVPLESGAALGDNGVARRFVPRNRMIGLRPIGAIRAPLPSARGWG